MAPTGSFNSGPIIPPVMTTILPRRSPASPAAEMVNVPGLVTSPRTPVNPRRYAVTPRPSRLQEIEEEQSPIPAPAFDQAEEEPADSDVQHLRPVRFATAVRPTTAPLVSPSGEGSADSYGHLVPCRVAVL